MKIISYIPLALVLALAFFGYQYASNQATTVRMLVDARTGLSSEPDGVSQLVRNLETEAATVAKRRADALKANQEAVVMAQKAREDMDAAQSELETAQGQLEDIKAKIAEAEAKTKQIEEENERMLNSLHSVPLLADASPEEANGKIEEYLKEYESEYDKVTNSVERKEQERAKLAKEVANLEVDLQDREEANRRFMEAYRKNGQEFVVSAVDPQWHFVVFSAGEDSGFYPGDSNKLLVHRNGRTLVTLRVVSVSGGQVVAEYDEKALPRGVQIEVGDRIFRQKPYGS